MMHHRTMQKSDVQYDQTKITDSSGIQTIHKFVYITLMYGYLQAINPLSTDAFCLISNNVHFRFK